MTSAMMNPLSKSVWILPAAWGAFVPFCEETDENETLGKENGKGVEDANLNGPSFDFVFSTGEEVNELQGTIAGHNDLIQSTESK